MTSIDPNIQHHPVVVAHRASRAADIQLRIADAITAFAGSMRFVYLHAVVFAVWMIFIESDPLSQPSALPEFLDVAPLSPPQSTISASE